MHAHQRTRFFLSALLLTLATPALVVAQPAPAEPQPEQAVELRHIAKAAGETDAGHRVLPPFQQLRRMLQSHVREVLPERAAGQPPKMSREMPA